MTTDRICKWTSRDLTPELPTALGTSIVAAIPKLLKLGQMSSSLGPSTSWSSFWDLLAYSLTLVLYLSCHRSKTFKVHKRTHHWVRPSMLELSSSVHPSSLSGLSRSASTTQAYPDYHNSRVRNTVLSPVMQWCSCNSLCNGASLNLPRRADNTARTAQILASARGASRLLECVRARGTIIFLCCVCMRRVLSLVFIILFHRLMWFNFRLFLLAEGLYFEGLPFLLFYSFVTVFFVANTIIFQWLLCVLI